MLLGISNVRAKAIRFVVSLWIASAAMFASAIGFAAYGEEANNCFCRADCLLGECSCWGDGDSCSCQCAFFFPQCTCDAPR